MSDIQIRMPEIVYDLIIFYNKDNNESPQGNKIITFCKNTLNEYGFFESNFGGLGTTLYTIKSDPFVIYIPSDMTNTFTLTEDIYLSSDLNGNNKIKIASVKPNDTGKEWDINMPSQFKGITPLYFIIKGITSSPVENQAPIPVSNIQITCSTPEASIYYTTDNTDPDETKNLYTDIFEVKTGTTVKAIGIKEGYNKSEITSLIT